MLHSLHTLYLDCIYFEFHILNDPQKIKNLKLEKFQRSHTPSPLPVGRVMALASTSSKDGAHCHEQARKEELSSYDVLLYTCTLR